MTNAELNIFLDLEWNCAAFTPEEASVSAPLSPKQWARIISRHPELQEFCPFAEFTPADWVVVLEKQLPFAWRCSCWKDFTPHQWQRLLRRQPTLLHYCEIPDHPAVRSGLLASDWPWDEFWFGKRHLYGDTFPHYLSCLTARAYWLYSKISGEVIYREKARKCLRNCLCVFSPDGTASCAYLYPFSVTMRNPDGSIHTPARHGEFFDPFANDQDGVLYMILRMGGLDALR